MALIKEILSREKRGKLKADVDYIKKVHKLLSKAIQQVKKSAEEIERARRAVFDLDGTGKTKEVKVIKMKIRDSMKVLTKALKDLDKAAIMYYEIDNLYPYYTDNEKRSLGELQNTWHNLDLEDLNPEQWSIITDIALKNKLNNARLMFG